MPLSKDLSDYLDIQGVIDSLSPEGGIIKPNDGRSLITHVQRFNMYFKLQREAGNQRFFNTRVTKNEENKTIEIIISSEPAYTIISGGVDSPMEAPDLDVDIGETDDTDDQSNPWINALQEKQDAKNT